MNTSPSRPQLSGYLRATCQRGSDGSCHLARKEHRAPIHLSKPYWDGSSLLLNVMCPTAGMLGGDQVELDVEIESGAALTLSNPSSLRIHKMDLDEDSLWDQTFKVDSEAFLECNPEWLILQAESAFTQRTRLEVEDGGELLFIETLAPGRIAHGEAFAFRRFRNHLSLRYGGRLAAVERHDIQTARNSHRSWSAQSPAPFYASIVMASPKLESNAHSIWQTLHELSSESIEVGVSRLASGPCWNAKLLATNPSRARQAIATIREHYYRVIGRKASDLRRH